MSKEAQSEVLLSDEQIREVISHTKIGEYDYKLLCAAQLKAVVEWLEQPCTEHVNEYLISGCLLRRHCEFCWAELKGEK